MKILCLGNNTEDTDIKTKNLALKNLVECHGLLSDLDNTVTIDNINKSGYYHSSVYDIEYGKLLEFGQYFDQVVVLDQSKEEYSHPDAFYKTIRLATELKTTTEVIFLNLSSNTDIMFFEELVETNKSFCIFPFIELLTNMRGDGYTTVCCRSVEPVTKLSELTNFQTNADYQLIRNKMIAGELNSSHCKQCYEYENIGIRSARQQETVEWANRLNLTSLNDLSNINHPVYYEIRPSNICNLQCRMCDPAYSNRIAKEYKKIKLISTIPVDEKTNFDIINFTNLKKLYVAGGEPTAMPEFYDFLDKCIDTNHTDFEFLVNTNATKINNRFKKQLKYFSNFQFMISIEAVGDINHYIRWPSKWDTIIENMHYLRNNNHTIATNTTVSIYNVTNLYTLLKFFDDEFPGMLVHCGPCNSKNDILSGFKFPDAKMALDRLLPITTLNCYKNDRLLKNFIDTLIAHYQTNPTPDLVALKLFFEFNDKLDLSRNVRLADYILELEKARKLIL